MEGALLEGHWDLMVGGGCTRSEYPHTEAVSLILTTSTEDQELEGGGRGR